MTASHSQILERIHTALFVGLGLGVLLSFGLGSGSFSSLKWAFLFLGAAIILVYAAAGLIRTRTIEIDKFSISLLILNFFAALSLIWSPDPAGGSIQCAGLGAFSVLMIYARQCNGPQLLFRICVLSLCATIVLLALGVVLPEIHGGFGNENYLSETILLCLPFVFGWFQIREAFDRWLGPILCVLAGVFLMLYSGSRVAAVGLSILGACWLILIFSRRFGPRNTILLLIVFVAGASAMGWLFREEILVFPPIQARLELYINSFALWLEYPLLGTGLGGFDFHYPRFQQFHLTIFPYQEILFPALNTILVSPFLFADAAHNEFLQILVETGVVGLAIFLGVVFQIVCISMASTEHSALRAAGVSAAILFLVIALMNFPLRNPATAGMGALILGILARGAGGQISPALFKIHLSQLSVYSTGIAAIFCLALTVFGSAKQVLASRDFAIYQLVRERLPGRTLFYARRAYDQFPVSVRYRRDLFAAYVDWFIKYPKKSSIPSSHHAWYYDVGLSAGNHNPAVLLTRLRFLILGNAELDKSSEIESIFATFKKFAPNFFSVNFTEGDYAKATGDLKRANKAYAKAKAILKRNNARKRANTEKSQLRFQK
ncbi:MAG: hypothetical protein CMM52_06625 [Rhodospirillaceae bacterium]|nr:hypothetical protein [Rhodospirillaceae bacterium]|tara:strand:+ start:4244 stop:6058 length:1815 start_codon:yes stop_codon:yes gene_type:complete